MLHLFLIGIADQLNAQHRPSSPLPQPAFRIQECREYADNILDVVCHSKAAMLEVLDSSPDAPNPTVVDKLVKKANA